MPKTQTSFALDTQPTNITLLNGDCLVQLKNLADNSVDSIVTDPPYGLSFMGKKWDYDVPTTAIWEECLRVLKPGGHLLAFFGTRTYHRGVVRIEDAGFEIRDQIMWLYGSGFPKSHDVSKGIDKQAGAEREIIGENPNKRDAHKVGARGFDKDLGGTKLESMGITAPATDAAKQWSGWGTALKPANEPIVVARKPLEKGLTIAENVVKWGTGALNIDASRIGYQSEADFNSAKGGDSASNKGGEFLSGKGAMKQSDKITPLGRWPANVLLDEDAASVLDAQSGISKSTGGGGTKVKFGDNGIYGKSKEFTQPKNCGIGDSGGASRFFYVAKASKKERNAGLEGMPLKASQVDLPQAGIEKGNSRGHMTQNFHPTVKPIKLMEYLIALVTPPNGIVLDPFMGSGSTGVAAVNLNRPFVGVELSPEYFEIAQKRIGTTNEE